MTELERSLIELRRELDWPPTPDVAARLVLARRRQPRRLLLAVAAAALAVAVAFAVPPARSAILRFFHLGGVTVERVETLPPAQERPLGADLGTPVSAADAKLVLGRPFRFPPAARGAPLYQSGNIVSTLFAAPKPVLLSELAFTGLLKKVAGASTAVQFVEIAPGVEGLWISGASHVVFGPAVPPRLAGNVLVWEQDGITFRLEGKDLERDDALRLARELLGTPAG
jgi:hypothetical protein